MKVKEIATCSVLSAVLLVICPFSVFVGPIPFSLSLFAVCLVSASGGKYRGLISVLIYILLGIFGIPVFSGFSGGLQKIAGLTGGYIIGYIPMSAVICFLTEKRKNKYLFYPLSMILGTVILYLFGTFWFMMLGKTEFSVSFLTCVAPFIIPDIIKIIFASVIAFSVNKRIKQN